MKKSKLLLCLFLLPSLLLLGFQLQESYNTSSDRLPYTKMSDDGQWYKINDDVQITTTDFLQKHNKDLGINTNEEWVNYRTQTDELGITHYRFQLHGNIDKENYRQCWPDYDLYDQYERRSREPHDARWKWPVFIVYRGFVD